jgi:hypothetical protein
MNGTIILHGSSLELAGQPTGGHELCWWQFVGDKIAHKLPNHQNNKNRAAEKPSRIVHIPNIYFTLFIQTVSEKPLRKSNQTQIEKWM